ncbi:MAG: bifunctional UDP-N-acetylmuramoyl-L-alanyl-D-glutamate--2,6-diaminopimelate ligase MurE/UDP-N-acetylmuramoyl-tripeptide--D-alanyl-D-alanine ligase MurF [Alcaligenaceae bacterium]
MTRSVLLDAQVSMGNVIALLRARAECGAHLYLDSRVVDQGDVFVACPGLKSDGRDYIATAIGRGAAAVLMHVESVEQWQATDYVVPVLGVLGLKERLGEIADLWYDQPSAHLTIMAVTGTNGKTSCVQWLTDALQFAGYAAGALGTLGIRLPNGVIRAGDLTTPDVISVHRSLAVLREEGAQYVALEASSIGLDQGRLNGVRIFAAGFTNLSRDHLDYHHTMHAYAQAKARLFTWPNLKIAVLNADDAVSASFAKLSTCPQIMYKIGVDSEAGAEVLEAAFASESTGTARWTLRDHNEQALVHTSLFGRHNVSNLLCVAGLLRALGWSLANIATSFATLKPVAGRLESVQSILTEVSVPSVLVDYAHTPDALLRSLEVAKELAQVREGKVWCVFGCGGNRDVGKRPVMGEIAQRLADRVLVTSDNPRDENPHAIIADIVAGLPGSSANVTIEPDRAQAILNAVLSAAANDVVLIAGKGHETYQEVCGTRERFDDRQWVQAAFLLKQGRTIHTDSRRLEAGNVFLALKGEHFDGHDYLGQIHSVGACAAIVDIAQPVSGLAQVELGDTRAALLQLGRAWRRQFTIPMIAVTGSNGKTTTKEMIASILAAWLGETNRLATVGNLNNELGVPLTLLRLRSEHRAAVIELGMNHPGEIAVLAHVTEPTVALVNNAQREHQEFMVSVEAVARENAAVYDALMPSGIKVFPFGDTFSDLWLQLAAEQPSMRFGLNEQAEVWASHIQADVLGTTFVVHTPIGEGHITLSVPGTHNLLNALAATTCAVAAGVPLLAIEQGLARFNAVSGRMQPHRLVNGQVLIDDSYNANPDSVRAAIDVLASLPAPRVLILGDMGEVGDNGPAMHEEVGHYARECGIDHLLTLGQATRQTAAAFGAQAVICESVEQASEWLAEHSAASILIKGSRFMRMEKIVRQYLEQFEKISNDVVKHAV